jgi:RNA polymerase sigma factor (TIGR02999 family)
LLADGASDIHPGAGLSVNAPGKIAYRCDLSRSSCDASCSINFVDNVHGLLLYSLTPAATSEGAAVVRREESGRFPLGSVLSPLVADANPTPATQLVVAAAAGDRRAADALLPLVYEQLRVIANERMAQERAGHTLQATALVHEAYVKLVGAGDIPWSGRAGFFHAASEAMRRILIDHARRRNAQKRTQPAAQPSLHDVADLVSKQDSSEILAFDEAFVRLEGEYPQAAAVIRLRFYAGLSVEQTAEALAVSPRTVNREWTFARAWLHGALGA